MPIPSLYPGAPDVFSEPNPATSLLDNDHADRTSHVQNAIEAMQGEFGLTPSGNAATVAARLANAIPANLKSDFGAVGDDATDDTAALTAAFAALAAGDIRLIMPKGIYRIAGAGIALPQCGYVAVDGAGEGASVIRQMDSNLPIITTTVDNTHSIKLRGFTIEYATPQTGSDAIAMRFYATAFTSGFYFWHVDHVQVRNAYIDVGIAGTGQVPVWSSTFEHLEFNATKHQGFNLVSPSVIGMPLNTIRDVRGFNDPATLVSSGDFIRATAVELAVEKLDIEGWYNGVIRVDGGAPCKVDGVHFERHKVTADGADLFFVSDNALTLRNVNGELDINIASETVRPAMVHAYDGAALEAGHIVTSSAVTAGSGIDFIRASAVAKSITYEDVRALGASPMVIPSQDTAVAPRIYMAVDDYGVSGRRGFDRYVKSLSDIVTYCRFGEASGTTAVDEMGTQDGAYQNAPTLGAPGLLWNDPNTAVRLNGTDEYISFADVAGLDVGNVFSIVLCVQLDEIRNQYLAYGNATGSFAFEITAGNALRIVQDSVGEIALGTVTPQIGVPQTIGWTRTGNGGDKIYLNGADVTGSVTSLGPIANPGAMTVGSTGFSAFLKGVVDEFIFASRDLTPAEMATLAALRRGY